MSKPRALKLIGIVAGALTAVVLLLLVAAFAFFQYMSVGELRAAPRGQEVTVAFSDSPEVYRVMFEACQNGDAAPTLRQSDYQNLLARGTLARASDGTPILLQERRPCRVSHLGRGRGRGGSVGLVQTQY